MKKIDELYIELEEADNTAIFYDILMMLVTAIELWMNIDSMQRNIYDNVQLAITIIVVSLTVTMWAVAKVDVKRIENQIDNGLFEITETSDL